ncbi:MAG TPA: hypothetical protein VJM49_16085, partial [Acidimicrobiales bacterium]|nr:hypothetical protein [Acidimicrobiales bacterium]
ASADPVPADGAAPADEAASAYPAPVDEAGPVDEADGSPSAPAWRRPLGVLGGVALGLGLLATWGAGHGERQAFPTRNLYEVRVLPYPDRVRWFADHGMPQADAFVGPDARVPHVEPGLPPVVFVGDDDPELGEWLDWVHEDGRAAFVLYAATHPDYLVSEPLRVPERTFNNALGDREFYRAIDQRRVPVVDRLLARRTAEVMVAVGLAVGWAIGRRRATPAFVAGAVTAALALPHGAVAWHSDGMETARHLVVPALQFHLGLLLMLVGMLPAARAAAPPGEGDGAAGEQPAPTGVRSRHG